MRQSYIKEQIHNLARQHNIPLRVQEQKIRPGWCSKSKGLLQILYERGYINVDKLDKYGIEGTRQHKDENGQARQEHKPYLLREL